ncbi:B12-binding domain-containing radical SAM protein [Methanobacterium sp.]|uniref:B12-binding domain-containing radical SAM protein n=1 Tax=Methanobacterium sp. TaxID=2164 RepID=UPI003C7622EA
MKRAKNKGYKIVLTANRTLMSHYNGLVFLGFGACISKGLIPDKLYFSVMCPSIEANWDGSTENAPCGTRKIEAALLNKGFKSDDIIVAHPEHLSKVIGPNTRVLSITEIDPLGIAPATSTFRNMFGGKAYMSVKFEELLNHPHVQKYKPKIIIGGPGAWQLEDAEIRNKFGVDCVIIGEGEKVVNSVVEKALNNKELPEVVHGEVVGEEEIPLIKNPTIDGIVEISRGCGRGCKFCAPTLQRFRCLPIEHILKEVELNLKAGKQPLLHAEDILRYKAKGFQVNTEAVTDLFRQVSSYPGVNQVQISHFALSSVANDPDAVEEISNILDLDKNGKWLSGQTGIETGSPRLISEIMRGKCKPYKPEDWPQVVADAFQILSDNSWVPVSTLIIGIPGETEHDVQMTIDLVKELREFKSIIVPLFFVSQGGLKKKSESFSIDKITRKECELLMESWKHTLNWAETLLDEYFKMAKDNHVKSFLAKKTFSFSSRKAIELVKMCENEYDYNMPAMVNDARNGDIKLLPQPMHSIYNYFMLPKRQ